MAANESAVQIRGFKGLNVREHMGAIQDNELSEVTNFNIGRSGELVKRMGFIQISSGSTLGANTTIILGHYITDSISQIIVKAGSSVFYTTDGITYTLLGVYSDASFGVQYAGEFYIIRSGNTIVKWDGSAAAAIAGSPSGTFAIIYKERMFVLNTLGVGSLNSRFYFSKAGDVTATGWVGTNFIDVQAGDGDFLTSMAVVQDLLVIFKGASTWALYVQGSTTDWVLRSLNSEVGNISKYAIQLIEGFIYISAARGVYRTDGAVFENVSDPISPILAERIVNTTTVNIDSFAYWDDKLICLLAPDASTKVYYVFHVKVGGWTKWEFAGGIVPATFLEVLTNTPQRGLYAGSYSADGKILRYGSEVFKDLGSDYSVTVKTKQFDLDIPLNMKRGKWIGLDSIGEGTFNWSNECDTVVANSGSVDVISTRALVKIPGPGYFRAWRFILECQSDSEITILGMTIQVQGSRTAIKALT